ncbi:MAG: sigma-70 family RNA polymerase sigma factor [Pirellulales bacterium]|nr:sigma-70 family RNA polymerase sigma factor [Pirellulales bacterium]
MNQAQESSPKTDPLRWVDEYGDFLFRYAKSRLREDQAAEDAVQDTFVAALKHADQYSGAGAEKAWLLGILKRKIIDLVRKRQRSVTSEHDDNSTDISGQLFDRRGHWRSDPRIFGPTPDSALEQAEFWEILKSCMQGIPQRQADVFALRELDGLNTQEICQELQVSPSNLWVLLSRARMRLSNCLKLRWQP